MGDFGQWLSRAPATVGTAFEAHGRVAPIQLCEDGNGRTARLVTNLVLLRGGHPPVVIGLERRTAYLDGLDALSARGDPLPCRRFMTDRLDASLDHHPGILRRG